MNELENARSRFLDICSEWADLLIADSTAQVERGGQRWQFGESIDEWVEKLGYGYMPDAQLKVWKGGYQLMLDAFDAASVSHAPDDESRDD
jgi:hypothetical protein